MANGTETQIDKLGIDISVRENDAAAKINAVADAVAQLRTQLASLTDVSKQMNKLTQMFGSLKIPQTQGIKTNATQPILKKVNINEETGEVSELSLANATEIVSKNYEMATSQAKYNEELRKTKDLQNDNSKNINKSAGAFSKLTKSIGRIAFYRAIRTALKEIVQGAKEGLANLRQVNPELNKSINSISLASTSLKNSFASILMPIIQRLEPIITRIADAIANVTNRINEAKAALSGEDSYTKILTSDTEEYQKQLEELNKEKKEGNLLSFDTFKLQSKQKQSDYTGTIKDTVDMSKEEASGILGKLKEIKIELLAIAGVIVIIKGYKLISGLADLCSSLKATKTATKEATLAAKGFDGATATLATVGIASLALGVVTLIQNWKDMGATAKWLVPVLAVLAGVIATIVALVKMGTGQWVKALSIGAIATGIGLTVGSTIATMKFANGGNYETGDFFMANENGKTELVASSNSGGGSVMNLDQWASISYSSFYRALSDYNAAQNGRGGEFDINSLGRTIAGNTGFVNEMNRRNSSLNLI